MSNEYLLAVEQTLRDLVSTSDPRYAPFFTMFQYHLGWTDAQGNPAHLDTGKRLRPLLCLWSCAAAGGNWRDALPAAAAVELVHNFSLIHDDIEDNSAERRGRTTVWQIWGLAQGINSGDALFVLAQRAMDQLARTVPLDRGVEIRRVLNQASFQLTQGQYLDIGFERADQVSLDHYFEMVRGKTAALIAAACEIGGRVATSEEELVRALADYGENLGIAFQISDDMLGLWGDPAITGKSARSDLSSRKKSYPVLAAMQSPHGAALRALYAKPEWSETDLTSIETILRESGAQPCALQEANVYAQRALEALAHINLPAANVTPLSELVHQVVHRNK